MGSPASHMHMGLAAGTGATGRAKLDLGTWGQFGDTAADAAYQTLLSALRQAAPSRQPGCVHLLAGMHVLFGLRRRPWPLLFKVRNRAGTTAAKACKVHSTITLGRTSTSRRNTLISLEDAARPSAPCTQVGRHSPCPMEPSTKCCLIRPDRCHCTRWPALQRPAAMGTASAQFLGARAAIGSFERADEGIGAVGRQGPVAALAIQTKRQHHRTI